MATTSFPSKDSGMRRRLLLERASVTSEEHCWPGARFAQGAQQQVWSGRRVSNSRPQAWEAGALPTELLPLMGRILKHFHRFFIAMRELHALATPLAGI